jgi:hypothetical protein
MFCYNSCNASHLITSERIKEERIHWSNSATWYLCLSGKCDDMALKKVEIAFPLMFK